MGRLDGALCKIEFASTLHLIEKYFPKQGRVCDIGGGPGRYTIELARQGHQVTLFDLSEAEIQFARARLDELGLRAEQLLVGDARDLGRLDSESFDAALLMGPMYHVIDPAARAQILHELARILKPGGIAIVAYLNSWGLMKTGIIDFPYWYENVTTLRDMLKEHTFDAQSLAGFTECYWSIPEAALQEVKAAGLEAISYAGAESFASGQGPLLEQLRHEKPLAFENVVQVAAETCELPQYRDATDHLHIVVRKIP
jgi:2-polyprenyl-3-methyl-5-hydroxy-6-metoxy-1,4-benzoquinol methylase